ncbi:unnamed protein product [Polarella glacialis]|uniref:Uncharacterized protein n=1 Tax=Polarella glacialis TaxID=89957 RepID=A0A813J0E8_POLGL|nr:unnamed protein product [Polarella glacialis]
MEDGNLIYLGRIDTQVKLHGIRIELEGIEYVLRADESVAEAVVVMHDHSTPRAFLSLWLTSRLQPHALRAAWKSATPSFRFSWCRVRCTPSMSGLAPPLARLTVESWRKEA